MYCALHPSCFEAIHSASSAPLRFLYIPSPLHFFSHSLAPGPCRMQTEEATGVEVLLSFQAAVTPSSLRTVLEQHLQR